MDSWKKGFELPMIGRLRRCSFWLPFFLRQPWREPGRPPGFWKKCSKGISPPFRISPSYGPALWSFRIFGLGTGLLPPRYR